MQRTGRIFERVPTACNRVILISLFSLARQIGSPRVQLVRSATWERRGDGTRNVRQHSTDQQTGVKAGAPHTIHPYRRGDGHLRRSRTLRQARQEFDRHQW